MDQKDIAQLIVSAVTPFVAAGVAVWVAAAQQRERIHTFIGYRWLNGGPIAEISMFGVHNRSSQSIAITQINLRRAFARRHERPTALDYSDPGDLLFPYVVKPGEILQLPVEERSILKLAETTGWLRLALCILFRRPRVRIEGRTTTGRRLSTSAEPALDFDKRAGWCRG